MPSKKDDLHACVSLFVFFIIRRGTFQYIIEDDGSLTSQTPTTHYTNTCVKLTIVTDISFSERIAIANLSYAKNVFVLFLSGVPARRLMQVYSITVSFSPVLYGSIFTSMLLVKVVWGKISGHT